MGKHLLNNLTNKILNAAMTAVLIITLGACSQELPDLEDKVIITGQLHPEQGGVLSVSLTLFPNYDANFIVGNDSFGGAWELVSHSKDSLQIDFGNASWKITLFKGGRAEVYNEYHRVTCKWLQPDKP